jgi:hypothetical protein
MLPERESKRGWQIGSRRGAACWQWGFDMPESFRSLVGRLRMGLVCWCGAFGNQLNFQVKTASLCPRRIAGQ